jgi:hypothetical protein
MLILNIFKFSLLLQLKHNIKQSSYQIIGDNKGDSALLRALSPSHMSPSHFEITLNIYIF